MVGAQDWKVEVKGETVLTANEMFLKSSFTGCIYKHRRPYQWLKVPILEAPAPDVSKFTSSWKIYFPEDCLATLQKTCSR